MLLGKNEYKLILFDTNALREIVTNENYSGKGFLSKFFAEQRLYAPCFSIYNAVELMPYKDIYEKFLDFFSNITILSLGVSGALPSDKRTLGTKFSAC